MHSSRYVAGLLWLLASCYDAPRTNPFDPALTPAVELLNVVVDSTSGSAQLEWSPYAGKQPFAEYRVLRQVHGLVAIDTVVTVMDVRQTSFRDTTPEPALEYTYWVEVVNQGGYDVESGKREGVVYALPAIELLAADFSSDTATAALVWSQYRGPGFEVYEVWRKAPGLDEEVVKELTEVNDTTYVDSLLDGNTEYSYHIVVRTEWEEVEVSSNEKSGRFYPFDHRILLEEIPDAELRAIGLAVDEQDRLYIAMTMRETRSILGGRLMKKGVQIYFPGIGTRTFFSEIRPDRESSIYMVAGQGRVYVSVRSGTGKALIAALSASGEEIWSDSVDTEGNAPVGLLLEEDGEVLMADDIALLYRFGPGDHQQEKGGLSFQFSLSDFQSLPVGPVVVGPGVGRDGGDHFFFLTSNLKDHHVLAVSRRPKTEWSFIEGSVIPIDEGIGPEKGNTLNPVALTFDPHRKLLLVLEAQGRLQIFDGRYDAHRYITQLGRFGTGDGEFLISQPTSAAVAVDSRGTVYVADGSGRIQVFAP